MESVAHKLFIRHGGDHEACHDHSHFEEVHMGLRISSVFVILVSSSFGSFFPILSSKYSFIRLPPWCFFIAKFFGSGVIVATAFIHLLDPAIDSLGEECLGGVFTEYPMALAICLISLMVMFFIELIAYRYFESRFLGESADPHMHSHFGDLGKTAQDDDASIGFKDNNNNLTVDEENIPSEQSTLSDNYNFMGQLLNVVVLDFGIMFHSVFVGLTLAVAGDEFKTLYVVIVFHQLFEGLGLGSRIATISWPTGTRMERFTPYMFALMYGLTTPISIAIGLGVRKSYAPGSRTSLITNGVFDSISAGILIYTGLVELMANEFLFSDEFKGKSKFKKMLLAYVVMCFGAGLMALLGKWA